jgi:Flp pilus assembly pilin Flp
VKGGESDQALSGGGRNGAVNLLSSPQEAVSKNGEAVMKRILGYLKDERGIETLEWIAMGALILGVAFVVYPGTLQGELTTLVTRIGTALGGIAIAP